MTGKSSFATLRTGIPVKQFKVSFELRVAQGIRVNGMKDEQIIRRKQHLGVCFALR